MINRFNCLFRGTFEDMTIVGFKTQFTFAYSEDFKHPFIKVDKGTGMNPDTGTEGIHYKNFFGTYVIGPLLTLNPYFTRYLLKTIGVEDPKLAFEDVIIDAYDRRLKEFLDPKCNYY